MITIYPYDRRSPQRGNTIENVEQFLASFWNKEVVVLGSARAGLYFALQYYGLKRQDHIFVPDYLCQAVLNILNKTSFPVKYIDQRTKAIFLLHQWGFPQKMDEVMEEAKKRKLLVIEDCVHSFNSSYRGQKIGTLGDAAIFSFPKLFPTCIGGVIASSNHELISYVIAEREKRKNLYNFFFNMIASLLIKKSFTTETEQFLLDAIYLKSIQFPNISTGALRRFPDTTAQLCSDMDKRKNNYLFIKDNIKDEYLKHDLDQNCDVTPLCVPLFLPLDKLEVAQGALRGNNIITEILHFDIQRNMLHPDYRKCLAVPCHQNLEKNDLMMICKIINSV